MKKLIALLLALCLVFSLVACGEQQGSKDSQNQLTITDMMGKTVTLDGPATRVVALTAADCEILYAIGAGSTLVGRGEYCDYPTEISSVPSVESGYETNLEQVIALAPQVVILNTMNQSQDLADAMEKAGVKVVWTASTDIQGVYAAIELIGAVTGKNEQAASLVKSMKDGFAAISSAPLSAQKTVYFEVSPLAYGLWTAGAGTFMDEVANLMNLKNIFADMSGWAEVSEEQVISRNPDIIVTISMYYGEGPTPTEEILSRSAWSKVSAVENKLILNLQNNELSRPGPRLLDGAKALYDLAKTAK